MRFIYLNLAVILVSAFSLVAIFFVSKSQDQVVYKGNNLAKSNSWFSSVYSFPTKPVYVLPYSIKLFESGIGLSYPEVVSSEKSILSSFNNQCLLNISLVDIPSVEYGDWHTILNLETKNSTAKLYLSKDTPFIYLETEEFVEFNCQNSSFVLQNKENFYRIIVLPENSSSAVYNELTNSPWEPVDYTQVEFSVDKDIITKYKSKSSYKLIYPHQLKNIDTNIERIGFYKTHLGEIFLVKAQQVQTKVVSPNLPLEYKMIKDTDLKPRLIQAIQQDISEWSEKELSNGVYFKGTELGVLTSLVQLSYQYDVLGKELILDKLEKELINSLDNFEYDNLKFMLVAKNDEFGNKEGNDHHFHYGYYIRAAAILAKYKPDSLKKTESRISELIADIASLDNPNYPRLRNYSVYEGHSWASGWAPFEDGNNQESASEALNAWYAIKIWGEVMKDDSLKNLGAWLFSQELEGAKSYWFGIDNSFPDGYKHEIASIVWGGKRDYATWFSAEDMHIYGIQWLPITPASSYYIKSVISAPQINEIKNAYNNPTSHEWGDLYLAYLSHLDPKESFENIDKVKSFAGLKIKSLLLQTVFSNLEVK